MSEATPASDPRLAEAALRGRRERPAWMGETPRGLAVAKVVILTAVVVMVAFPFLSVLATSLASDRNIIESGGFVIFPKDPTLNAYRTVLQNGVVLKAMLVSVGVTTVGTAVSLVLTTLMAYGLAQQRVKFRPVVYMVLFSMLFTPGIIPNYLIVRQLGLLDTYAALILPMAINAFNLIVMRQFFMSIPSELLDSARVDGAGELRILVSIVLPLAKPAMAVIGLFYAVAYWNAFFGAMLYLNDNSSWPLQMIVRMYVLQGSNMEGGASDAGALVPQSTQMAVVVLATVPILLVYPFLQRYFTSGVLSGAIKG